MIYILGCGKIGYLTGEKAKPDAKDSMYVTWDAKNSMVMAWLVNAMEEDINANYLGYSNAKDMWGNLNQMYSDLGPIPEPVVTLGLLFDPRLEPNLNQQGKIDVHIPKPSKVVKTLATPATNEITDLDVLIAVRKGVWSCTTHPIAKYLSYHRLVDGSIERHKVRLVAKGFTQTYGLDYQETFTPVAKVNSIRILLFMAAIFNWPLHQLDVKNAFLNDNLKEEIFMDPPPGFESVFGYKKVCRPVNSLYGLKQSHRAWFKRFGKVVKKFGYCQTLGDHTLFFKHSSEGKKAILIVYVDDIILTGDDEKELKRLKELLASEFEIKDLGELKYFLGMEFAISKEDIFVS
ncbi:hypothetical protein LWI28_019702 [Acer negundo]|uniref:Reverse transcriptase Ty1/copia-type domain-containing protein n=1 Tax=Acer negundo TaxID=4023 RepID=A0AAD5NR02_ACENE|nr:hypothetical protein LWI28_019702 [Acer negundo]